MTYQGEATLKTRLGSLMTILTYVLSLISLYNLSVQFVDKSAQKENSDQIKVNSLEIETQQLETKSFILGISTY